MYKRATWDIDQEGTEEDLERMGQWPQQGITQLTDDLLVSGRMYKGFTALASGAAAIEVAPGRIYDSGAMFALEAGLEMAVDEFVPITAGQKVYVTLIGQGREDDGYVEARNYEREVPQSGGGTAIQQVPQTGARAKVRNAILTLYPGAPALTPVKPSIPLGTVAIADILIGTGGIESIAMRTANEAPELDALAAAYTAVTVRLGLVDQEMAGLRNDLAALARLFKSSVSRITVQAMQGDIAAIKDRLDIPDTGSPYSADNFLDERESDAANVDYKARVLEGIRFPAANQWKGPLALYNANDGNLMHANAGLICPRYTAVDGIRLWERAGSTPLGGTVYQTMELTQMLMSRQETAYGDYFQVCSNSAWWSSGQYDPAKGVFRIGEETYEVGDYTIADYAGNALNHTFVRLRKFWNTTVKVPYDVYAPVAHTIQGVLKSQSWLQSQNRWSPGMRLAIESWSTGAEVTVALVECAETGVPLPGRMLKKTTLAASQFKVFPEETRIPWATPVFLESGKRYAYLFATTGDVTVAYAEGQKFLSGNYFETTDGAFFVGDLTRDLCHVTEFCQFSLTSLTVLLQGVNLDGGIHNIRIRNAEVVPQNSSRTFQLQVGGAWRPIEAPEGDDTLFGSGVTPYYDFRVVLNGNQWAMPILDMGSSEVELFRADDDLRHISSVLAFGSSIETIYVKATIGAWDAARHALAARLAYGAGYATLKTHDAVETKPVIGADGLVRADAVEKIWTFSFAAPGISTCKIDFLGTTNNPRVTYHVERRVQTTE
ncbi:hypothetical protein IP86_10765 [Rhodopseudomonas sp. AAP120]|uniref:hypothetical protein n=1 Tax=Rhodopseudomonas sp. AAP120 TaxID=1523430 RepID=UPI0006B97C7B|nr:hypothetical protein [Rhodopseudomonas sp. AAP120]KPF98804.1 hypothetical protein IP86_10765 [Rhodopseudomonas sp. AAP120]